MTCYMCGSPATRRMSPDMDIYGILLCGDVQCETAWWAITVEGENWDKWRKRLHKSRGNKMPKP